MTRKTAGLPLSYRLAVTSRSLAALLGGYLLASLASVCIASVSYTHLTLPTTPYV